MQWLFPVAVTLHNSEEAMTMPGWVLHHSREIPFHPGATKIHAALLVLSLSAFTVTYLSARKGKQSFWAYLIFGGITAMLLNVFVPHLPATLILRQYTPGVLTAVAINLPVMSLLMCQAIRERWVSGRRAHAYGVMVPVTLAVAIIVVFAAP